MIDGSICVCVLDRGWIFVGKLYEYKEGILDGFKISNCYNVRRWGTTEGLGEISTKGPTKDTILDRCNDLFFDKKSLIFIEKCNEDNWKKVIVK